MFELLGKKIMTILHANHLLNLTYDKMTGEKGFICKIISSTSLCFCYIVFKRKYLYLLYADVHAGPNFDWRMADAVSI